MERVAFVEHRGRRILVVDYSGLRNLTEIEPPATQATQTMAEEPRGSVLALVDLTGVPLSLRSTRQLGELAVSNAPFVKARALVGIPAAARPVMRAISQLSGRPMEAFSDRESALDWLAEQA